MLYGVDRRRTHGHAPAPPVREGNYLSPDSRARWSSGASSPSGSACAWRKIVVIAPAADGTLGSAALRVTASSRPTTISTAAWRSRVSRPRASCWRAARGRDDCRSAGIEALETAAASLAELAAPDQEVVTWKVLLPEAVQMLELIRVNLYIILLVVFVVVALGVVNTLLMAVLERTREFGLQLALGTRPGQIVRTVLYESLVLGVLGLAAGIVIGSLIVGYYHSYGFDLTAYAAATKAIPGMTGVVYPTIVFGNVWLPVVALLTGGGGVLPGVARRSSVVALRRI